MLPVNVGREQVLEYPPALATFALGEVLAVEVHDERGEHVAGTTEPFAPALIYAVRRRLRRSAIGLSGDDLRRES